MNTPPLLASCEAGQAAPAPQPTNFSPQHPALTVWPDRGLLWVVLAVGYVRVSTDRQAREGVSLEAQTAKINAWCAAHGAELLAVYQDAGISGSKTRNPPGLEAALKQATGKQAALVVYSLSRLARSTRDAILISENLSKAGADLVSLTERIDTTSAAGKMVFRLLAVLAEFERDLVSERTTAALGHLKAQGRKLGGPVPYGYAVSPCGRFLLPNPTEQAALTLLPDLRRQGQQPQADYRATHHRRVPSPHRPPYVTEKPAGRKLVAIPHQGRLVHDFRWATRLTRFQRDCNCPPAIPSTAQTPRSLRDRGDCGLASG